MKRKQKIYINYIPPGKSTQNIDAGIRFQEQVKYLNKVIEFEFKDNGVHTSFYKPTLLELSKFMKKLNKLGWLKFVDKIIFKSDIVRGLTFDVIIPDTCFTVNICSGTYTVWVDRFFNKTRHNNYKRLVKILSP